MPLRIFAGLGLAFLSVTAAQAQLPAASAAGAGMGDNYTAVARGFSAVSWNPANLGLTGNPRGSLALAGVSGTVGLGPITPADLAQYDGVIIPDEAKRDWLERIQASDGERGSAGAEVTLVAGSIWRLGFQVGSSVHTVGNVAADAAELLLFGNAGLTGEPRSFTTLGSTVDVAATTTGAVSYAQPFQLGPDRRLSIGTTVKYTMGHAVFTGEDLGSEISTEPLELNVNFPVILNDTVIDANVGRGWGLDVGASWEQANWVAGVTVRNLVNTFAWDETKLVYSPGTLGFDSGTGEEEEGSEEDEADVDLRPLSEAPEELRNRLEQMTYSPILSAGVAYRPSRRVLLSADVRTATGDGLQIGPRTQVGIGTELRIIPLIPLRGGVSVVSGGYKLSGGLGLELGPVKFTAGGSVREDEFGSGVSGMFLFSLGGR